MNKMLETALAAYEAEYKDKVEILKQLEQKAQILMVANGVLLTGSIAISTRVARKLPLEDRCLFFLLALGLFANISITIWALLIRGTSAPPYRKAGEMAAEIALLDDAADDDRQQRFVRDQIKLWILTNSDLKRLVKTKSRWLLAGQLVVMFVFLILLSTFCVLIYFNNLL